VSPDWGVAIVRGWVDLYTRGLPDDVRHTRRDEIDDDLWCEHEETVAAGRSANGLQRSLALRLVLGIPSDVSWRFAVLDAKAASQLNEGSNTRTLGAVAIFAGLVYATLMILFIPFGEAIWLGTMGVFGVLGSMLGAFAFIAAGLGLAWEFQDHISRAGAVGSWFVMVGALASLGATMGVLALGTALLIWDVARIGVVPRLLGWAHVGTSIVVVAGALAVFLGAAGNQGVDLAADRLVFVALLAPYLATWLAIGASMFHRDAHAWTASG
jgi:hypothetical protein